MTIPPAEHRKPVHVWADSTECVEINVAAPQDVAVVEFGELLKELFINLGRRGRWNRRMPFHDPSPVFVSPVAEVAAESCMWLAPQLALDGTVVLV